VTATALYPHTVSHGHYTVEQVEGETCVECGLRFRTGQAWVYLTPGLPDARLARHVACVELPAAPASKPRKANCTCACHGTGAAL